MEIITRRIYTKSNPDQSFYKIADNVELQSYIDETYVQTGKRKSIVWTFSEDNTTLTVESHWASEEDFHLFLADPKIIQSGKLIAEYNAIHNIVEVVDKRPNQS